MKNVKDMLEKGREDMKNNPPKMPKKPEPYKMREDNFEDVMKHIRKREDHEDLDK